jgi:hypothetical protein
VATALAAVGLILVIGIYVAVAFNYLRITPGDKEIWKAAQRDVADVFFPEYNDPDIPEKPARLDPQTPIWFCFDDQRASGSKSRLYLSEELAAADFPLEMCEARSSPEALKWIQLGEDVRYSGERLDFVEEKLTFYAAHNDQIRERAVEKAAKRRGEFRQELVEWSTIIGGFWLLPGVLIGYLISLWTRKPSPIKQTD